MKFMCDESLPFSDCELALLRNAVDKAEDVKGYKMANSEEIKSIISIVEKFIKQRSLICYGGTAINNILPKKDQFYDLQKEIPDYDFLSPKAMEHAKNLADIYVKMGYSEVEAKAGQHFGTYKVFVNYIPIADITQINDKMYKSLKKEGIKKEGLLYLPPNMLRMSMYLELSRPAGDISRWEKVLKRLTLLNKNYPLLAKNCDYQFFTRKMEKGQHSDLLFKIVRDSLVNSNVVFFGGYASNVFAQYMSKDARKAIHHYPDFDVLSERAEDTANILKDVLLANHFEDVSVVKHNNVDEYIPLHYEVKVNQDTLVFIYQTIACYSYNLITVDNQKTKIATIDTMLSLFLAFIYANKPYYDRERILCMANFLFKIQQKNRLSQKGPLKRFNIKCYGSQATKESIRAEKSEKYEELKDKRDTKEYELWFLNYKPDSKSVKSTAKPKQLTRKKAKSSKAKSKKVTKSNIQKLLKPLL